MSVKKKQQTTLHTMENRMVKALKIVSSVHSFVADFLFELACLLSVCSQSPFVMQKWKISSSFFCPSLHWRFRLYQIDKHLYMQQIYTHHFVNLQEVTIVTCFLMTPELKASVSCSPSCRTELLKNFSKQTQTLNWIGLRQKQSIPVPSDHFFWVFPGPNFKYRKHSKDGQGG